MSAGKAATRRQRATAARAAARPADPVADRAAAAEAIYAAYDRGLAELTETRNRTVSGAWHAYEAGAAVLWGERARRIGELEERPVPTVPEDEPGGQAGELAPCEIYPDDDQADDEEPGDDPAEVFQEGQ